LFATHAADQIETSMQIDDAGAAGGLMQAVHILSQKNFALAHRLEPRQSAMRVIRSRLTKAAPADETARPIALARSCFAHESLKGHRWRALPVAGGVAIIRNARIRAAAGAGEDEKALVLVDEILKTSEFRHEVGFVADYASALKAHDHCQADNASGAFFSRSIERMPPTRFGPVHISRTSGGFHPQAIHKDIDETKYGGLPARTIIGVTHADQST